MEITNNVKEIIVDAVEAIRTARASAVARGVPFNEWATRHLANRKAR